VEEEEEEEEKESQVSRVLVLNNPPARAACSSMPSCAAKAFTMSPTQSRAFPTKFMGQRMTQKLGTD